MSEENKNISPDDLTKTDKPNVELTEEQLDKASGGEEFVKIELTDVIISR